MALPDIPRNDHSRRLDSWKEIAEYLNRDVRTATRWEALGLPLHRVPGGKGRSVFAFTDEIDTWMAGRAAHRDGETDSVELASESKAAEPLRRPVKTVLITAGCVLVVIAVGVAAMSRGASSLLDPTNFEVTATPTQVSVATASGASRIIHQFGPGAVLVNGAPARVEDLDADGTPDLLVTVSYYDTQAAVPDRSGEILNLSLAGDVRWRVAFDDVISFGGGKVAGPWAMTDSQASPASTASRIAVAAHESTWWASFVAVLDSRGRRLSTFMNPGWIESLLWLPGGHLAIAGFNNLRKEAMFAVLDRDSFNGQAPGTPGTDFACLSCATAVPPFYATFARSELNRITAGGFNRARVSPDGDRIVVATLEIDREIGDATALYEFDRRLRFIRARYSDSYWDEHRRLELEGRLAHTRETCPERNGPAAIHVWDAAAGWVQTFPSGAS